MILQRQIADWLADHLAMAGADGFVLGLSGGVDSATTAALAAKAVGAQSVLTALLPCHSVSTDARLARRVADAFDIPAVRVTLDDVYDTLREHLPPSEHDLAAANIKPRLRMTVLYYLAQTNNYLVLGSGNKTELAVGYFTKYGDGGVDLLPLGDLYKTEVWDLARDVGVPQDIIDRAPSAGLWPGQTDEEELGITYHRLDQVLGAIEAGETADVGSRELHRVKMMIAESAHKRAMPPIFEKPAN
ncbi:MAG: NAD+ synthase [Anaerolineae bacterium]|jgi:NAD+ synthase